MAIAGHVLVTGAASGIGRATALLLAQKGFGVYATDMSGTALDDLQKRDGIEAFKLDITEDSDVAWVKKAIEDRGTGLFALVNNAGIFNPGPLMELPMARLIQQYNVNVFGTHRITKAVFPLLLKSTGRIVNLSSVAGYVATPFSGPYASSKHAIEGWSDALRRELAPLGVKVMVVEPALINTPLWDRDLEGRIEQYRGGLFYEANRKKLEHEAADAKANGVQPEVVAQAIYQALISPNPKPRDLVTNHPVLHRLVRYLPDRVLDRLLAREFQGSDMQGKGA
ncbi:MAG: SDR family oxidoreductase [Deltaproteobacteria bacterium]|nr:SDR family oxidoreductase [Deltaproteobacteria bacterium]